MVVYEISLKFEVDNNYPSLVWQQNDNPNEVEVLKTILTFAHKHQISLDYIEEKGVIFVETQESALYEAPDVYQVDFSRLSINDNKALWFSSPFAKKWEGVTHEVFSKAI